MIAAPDLQFSKCKVFCNALECASPILKKYKNIQDCLMDSPPPEPVSSDTLRKEVADEVARREISSLRQQLAMTRQQLAQLQREKIVRTTSPQLKFEVEAGAPFVVLAHQQMVHQLQRPTGCKAPKSAVLVLEKSTETPLFPYVAKFVVDLADCQTMRQELSARKVRQVFFIVPFTTDAAIHYTWQKVIDECIPANAIVLVCPAPPKKFLDARQIDAFEELQAGLDKWRAGVEVVSPLKSEAARPKILFGLSPDQRTEETEYWLRAEKLVEKKERLKWPSMVEELVKERRKRLRTEQSGDDRLSEEKRAKLVEKCILRYQRLDYRFERVERMRNWTIRGYFARFPFAKVKRHVEQFSAQQLDEFWHRMDRWEAWVRHDEFSVAPWYPISDDLFAFAQKCTTWLWTKIRTYF